MTDRNDSDWGLSLRERTVDCQSSLWDITVYVNLRVLPCKGGISCCRQTADILSGTDRIVRARWPKTNVEIFFISETAGDSIQGQTNLQNKEYSRQTGKTKNVLYKLLLLLASDCNDPWKMTLLTLFYDRLWPSFVRCYKERMSSIWPRSIILFSAPLGIIARPRRILPSSSNNSSSSRCPQLFLQF